MAIMGTKIFAEDLIFAERYRCAAVVAGATGASAAGVTDMTVGTSALLGILRLSNDHCRAITQNFYGATPRLDR